MALIITDDILRQANLSEQELLVDLACYLYERKRLSMGKARALVGMNLLDFQRELAKREIDLHYSEADFEQDMQNLGVHQMKSGDKDRLSKL
jgi:predicted HTH domain antitoxin